MFFLIKTHVPQVTQMIQTDKHCVQMDEKCVETEPVKLTLDTVSSVARRGGGSSVQWNISKSLVWVISEVYMPYRW